VSLVARRVSDRLPRDAAVQIEDLMSWGAIGLLEAFDRFDASRGIKFSTYAEYRIRGAMYDALRTHDSFSRRRRQLARRLEQAEESARKRLGYEPPPEVVAAELDMTLDDYWLAVDRVKPVSHVSFSGEDQTGRPLAETLIGDDCGPSARLTAAEARRLLNEAIQELPERERQSIMMYYGKDMSLAEIAAVYNVTVSRISQILGAARVRLRKKLAPSLQASDIHELEFSP